MNENSYNFDKIELSLYVEQANDVFPFFHTICAKWKLQKFTEVLEKSDLKDCKNPASEPKTIFKIVNFIFLNSLKTRL